MQPDGALSRRPRVTRARGFPHAIALGDAAHPMVVSAVTVFAIAHAITVTAPIDRRQWLPIVHMTVRPDRLRPVNRVPVIRARRIIARGAPLHDERGPALREVRVTAGVLARLRHHDRT